MLLKETTSSSLCDAVQVSIGVQRTLHTDQEITGWASASRAEVGLRLREFLSRKDDMVEGVPSWKGPQGLARFLARMPDKQVAMLIATK